MLEPDLESSKPSAAKLGPIRAYFHLSSETNLSALIPSGYRVVVPVLPSSIEPSFLVEHTVSGKD